MGRRGGGRGISADQKADLSSSGWRISSRSQFGERKGRVGIKEIASQTEKGRRSSQTHRKMKKKGKDRTKRQKKGSNQIEWLCKGKEGGERGRERGGEQNQSVVAK